MKPNERLKALADAPLGRLVMRFSWPALVSMTLNALYSIVDRIYIGQGCGQDAMAGLTLVFPVMMVFGAFGVFVGAGHAAVLSIKLGEGDRTACEKVLGELLALKLLFFFVLPPLVFVFLGPILRWTGGASVTPGAFGMAKTYLRIVLFSHIFSHIAFGLSAAMRSEGGVVPSMMCMVVGWRVRARGRSGTTGRGTASCACGGDGSASTAPISPRRAASAFLRPCSSSRAAS